MSKSPAFACGVLVAVAALLIVLSNTVLDGTDAGGLAFLGWVVALIAAIVVAARGLRRGAS